MSLAENGCTRRVTTGDTCEVVNRGAERGKLERRKDLSAGRFSRFSILQFVSLMASSISLSEQEDNRGSC